MKEHINLTIPNSPNTLLRLLELCRQSLLLSSFGPNTFHASTDTPATMPSVASNYQAPSGGPRIRLQPAPNEPMNLLDSQIDIEEQEEVQMGAPDPCCEAAKNTLAQAWAESNNMRPEQHQKLRDNMGDLDCDKLRDLLENGNYGPGTNPGVPERDAQILADWDACVEQSFTGDFTASADPFEVGWDAIIKYSGQDFSFPLTIPKANQDLRVDESEDPCCSEARELLATYISEKAQNEPNAMMANAMMGLYEDIMGGGGDWSCEDIQWKMERWAQGSDWERKVANEILDAWNKCSEKTSMFTASADPFEVGWNMIVKEGLEDVPEENQHGNCYEEAGRWVCFNPGYSLAHAQVTGEGAVEGHQYGHAFTTYMGDLKGNVHEGEPVQGEHIEWAYDPTKDVRLPLSLYGYSGRFNTDDMLRYTPDETREKMLEHRHWGPWDERAKEWLHSERRQEEDEDDEA